jgi:hypothetical protein
MQFHYDAARGGINNYNKAGGTKTDYFNILATSEMRTVGQKWGISSLLASFSGGDTIGIQTNVTQFGGYDTGGDEQTEGLRIQIQQGSSSSAGSGGVFEGVVLGVDGHTLTYAPTRDERTLGEHRLVRDLSQVYRDGTIASIANSGGSPNAVSITGNGTHWSKLGLGNHTYWNDLPAAGGVTQTNLAFCLNPLRSDGYDVCFPVSKVVDDTHITLNLIATGTNENTQWPSEWPHSGSYGIYSAAWPVTVDLATHTIIAPDLSGIERGDKIDQVLAYNTQTIGQWIVVKRHIGIPGKGGGISISNFGSAESPRMQYGLAVSGAFGSAIEFQASNASSGVSDYFARFAADPATGIIFDSTKARLPASEVSLWQLRDSGGKGHVMLSFLRDTATTCVLDGSLCVQDTGAVNVKQLNQTEANNYAGKIDIKRSNSGTVEFKVPFHTSPVCSLTPTSDPSALGSYWVSTSPSTVSAFVQKPGQITFNFICVGNPN